MPTTDIELLKLVAEKLDNYDFANPQADNLFLSQNLWALIGCLEDRGIKDII